MGYAMLYKFFHKNGNYFFLPAPVLFSGSGPGFLDLMLGRVTAWSDCPRDPTRILGFIPGSETMQPHEPRPRSFNLKLLQTKYDALPIIYMNLKLITMSTKSYTLLKIGWRLFGLNWPDLTNEQRSKVLDIYDDFY